LLYYNESNWKKEKVISGFADCLQNIKN